MSFLEILRKFALSKGGVPFLIFMLVIGAFATGYNYFWVKNVFSQVKKNQKMINSLGDHVSDNKERIKQNDRAIRAQKKQDQVTSRNLRIIGCSLELTQTAKRLLKCEQLDFSKANVSGT